MINTSKCDFSTYKVRKLREDEVIKSFDCGDDDLNHFILDNAECYHKARLAETYVYEHIDNGNVIAYFSLANDRISIDDFSDNTEFNRFRRHRFKNEKRIKSYPAVKICRLGIDKSPVSETCQNRFNRRIVFILYVTQTILTRLYMGDGVINNIHHLSNLRRASITQ